MFKTLLTTTVAFGFAAALSVAPALAQTNTPSANAQELVDNSVKVVQQIKSDPRFASELRDAKGIFIMPDLVKGAFIVGGAGAQGVLLRHEANGTWSDPAFMTLGSISIGAQVGGQAGPAAMLLMTNKAVDDFTQNNNFSLGANAGLSIVNYSAKGQAPIGKGDIVVWSNQNGAFAGVTINGADVTQNTRQDEQYYGMNVKNATSILQSSPKVSGTQQLRAALA